MLKAGPTGPAATRSPADRLVDETPLESIASGIAAREDVTDVAKRLARIRVGPRGFRIIRKPVRDLCGKVAKLDPRQPHQFYYRQNHHFTLHRFPAA